MNHEEKQNNLKVLADAFKALSKTMDAMPGLTASKSQAFIKMHEALMWMQQAVISHVESDKDNEQNE